MSSITLELQHEALNSGVPVSTLLRKAFVVAHKLNLNEFHSWIDNELNGYKPGVKMPPYRIVHGRLNAFNPMRGWVPVRFNSTEDEELFSKAVNGQSIPELESLLEQRTSKSFISHPVSSEANKLLNKLSAMHYETQFQIHLQYSHIVHIIDSVRNSILNWTIKLEEGKILGEGMTFTSAEKKQASSKVYNNINHFYGAVDNSMFQVGSPNASQVRATYNYNAKATNAFLGKLDKSLASLHLNSETEAEIRAEISTIKSQIKSPKPKTSIVTEGLKSIRTILEGAGGGAVAQMLLVELTKHFPHLLGG